MRWTRPGTPPCTWTVRTSLRRPGISKTLWLTTITGPIRTCGNTGGRPGVVGPEHRQLSAPVQGGSDPGTHCKMGQTGQQILTTSTREMNESFNFLHIFRNERCPFSGRAALRPPGQAAAECVTSQQGGGGPCLPVHPRPDPGENITSRNINSRRKNINCTRRWLPPPRARTWSPCTW